MNKNHLLIGAIVMFIIVATTPYLLSGDSATGWGVKIISCSDSDDMDYYTPGEVSVKYYYRSRSNVNVYADRCTDEDNVVENFCYDNKLKKSEYVCPYGCLSGACIHSQCTDSDGGKDYYNKGVAVLEGKTKITEMDYCLNKNTLREYFCASQEEIRDLKYPCPNANCVNGVCS